MTSVFETFGLVCPACYRDDELSVVATVSLMLTSQGTVDAGDQHHWNQESVVNCRCGWSGTVEDAEACGRQVVAISPTDALRHLVEALAGAAEAGVLDADTLAEMRKAQIYSALREGACTSDLLELSTAHLDAEGKEWLSREFAAASDDGDGSAISILSATRTGWFMSVPDDLEALPQALAACCDQAQRLGCHYVLFDADGPADVELRTYDEEHC